LAGPAPHDLRRAFAKLARSGQAHALRPRIQSVRALARELGVNRITALRWLQLPPPHPTSVAELVEAAGLMPPVELPPAPWLDWDQIRRVHEDLRLHGTLSCIVQST
jgi:hypothetical protein